MANVFSFVGEIRPVRDSDKFHGYNKTEWKSGAGFSTTLMWNMVSGDNSNLVRIDARGWNDESKNTIYTFTAGENGNKGEKLQVAFKDRFDPNIVAKIANFKKFVIDTNLPGALKKAKDDGNNEEIEACEKKRHEFISELDFIETANKLVHNEKIKGMKWKVTGNVEYTYSVTKNQFYRAFIVQKIYRAADDAEPSVAGNLDLYFGTGSVDSESYSETKKYFVNCYTQFYENQTYKKNIFCPISLVICGDGDAKSEKKALGTSKLFSKVDDDEVKKLGVIVDFISGAQRREITEDDLTDEQRENISYGLTSLEEIARELNNGVYGDRIVETRITGLARGFSGGPQEAAYSASTDFALPIIEKAEDTSSVDLFADDEDLI